MQALKAAWAEDLDCMVTALQAGAVDSTRQRLQQELPANVLPDVQLVHACHSQMKVRPPGVF